MRPRVALISLLAGALGACAAGTSKPPRLSYAPPQEEVAALSPAAAAQPAGLIWNQLLDRLIQSPLQVDLADPARGIVVARYSGNPEPYVACGWILVDRGGEIEQVPASGEASFKRMVQGRQLEVNRGMNLDARLVVQVKPEGNGAAVETTSNYVLTKTIVAENQAGRPRGRAQEVVSFSSGGRGEFSKGTVCQPNGALERTVLDVLPRATSAMQAGGAGPVVTGTKAAGSTPAQPTEVVESIAPAPDMRTAETSVAEPETPTSESAAPAPDTQTAESAVPALGMLIAESAAPAPSGQTAQSGAPASEDERTAIPGADPPSPPAEADAAEPETSIAQAELPDPAALAVPDQTGQDVPYECPVGDRIFCEVLDLTDPYRRANQERDLGLALEALEPDNPLLDGSVLGVDISLPNYDSYLALSYFLKDGTVRHMLPGAGRRWPANAREFVPGFGLGDRQSVEMVVALASDVPVFPSPRPSSEGAEQYLSDLRQRLSELSNGGAPAQITVSLIVITPA